MAAPKNARSPARNSGAEFENIAAARRFGSKVIDPRVGARRPFVLRIAALDGVRYDGRRATAGFVAPPVFTTS